VVVTVGVRLGVGEIVGVGVGGVPVTVGPAVNVASGVSVTVGVAVGGGPPMTGREIITVAAATTPWVGVAT
jgi:hypothetical protein